MTLVKKGFYKNFLINITVLGSTGLVRFVVGKEELIAIVIKTSLKSYTCEGCLPVLVSNLSNFFFYCPNAGTEAVSPWETTGSMGVRNFMLFKKPQVEKAVDSEKSTAIARKTFGNWKAWFNKSLNRKIYSH